MKRFAKQEMASGSLFAAACAWLVIDMVRTGPTSSPSLYPVVPMAVATLWYLAIEFVRARNTV